MKKRKFKQKFDKDKHAFLNKIQGFIYWFKSLSIVKHILFFYLFITLIGSLLLYIPIAENNNSISYINSLFVSASAFSDTGLNPTVAGADFSYFGQTIIAILIFIGGTGWFALKIYFFNIIFRRPISLHTKITLTKERGSAKMGNTLGIIKISVASMIIVTLIASIILSFYFYYVPGNFNDPNSWLEHKSSTTFQHNKWGFIDTSGTFRTNQEFNPLNNWNTSIRYGLFHAISAVNNAGFDIMGAHSIAPYYANYSLQLIFIALFVFGGIGFPVIYDVYMWSRMNLINSNSPNNFKFSLFTKVSCISYLIIAIIGLGSTFLIEIYSKPLNGISIWNGNYFGSKGNRIMALFFNTMSTRNAGFATLNYQSFNGMSLIIHSVLMFIGSAPSSTGGGIRTTTIAVIFLAIWKNITNKSSVRVFKRQIHNETVLRSLIVFATAIILIILTCVILVTSLKSNGGNIPEGNTTVGAYTINDVIFEVCSAFGTTGLSTGLTKYLNTISKLMLILIMFIGQLGVSSTLLVWGRKKTTSRHYHYYKENISIG